jgi:hypothetical protein
MSNNIFKSGGYPNYKSKTNEPIVKEFGMKESDFPELRVENKMQNKSNNDTILQYKEVVLTSNACDSDSKDDLKPGWVKLYYDKNRKIVMEKYDENSDSEEDFHSVAQKGIQTLLDKWENERITYNNLYGEGEYERLHYMIKREEDNYSEDDSDDEAASFEETNEEYNEDSQYYDLY